MSHAFPQFLPDGEHVLYFVRADSPERRGVYVRSLNASDAKRVLPTDSPAVFVEPGYILTVTDQVLLAYPFSVATLEESGEREAITDGVGRGSFSLYPSATGSGNGVLAYGSASGIGLTQLVWTDRSGARLGTVGSPESLIQGRLSPDGTRAVLLKRDPRTNLNDIWITELSTQASAKFASDGGDPIWSPDGRRIAFYARRGAQDNALYDKPVGGGDERLLLPSPGNTEDWTKDGKSIVFRRRGATFLLPLGAEPAPIQLLPEATAGRNQFHLSPDGKWIAYTEGTEVWVASFPTFTDRRQVSNEGGDIPRWRSDQQELYYLAGDGRMMSVEIKAGARIEIAPPKVLFQTRILSSGGFDRYDVTPDGQRFLLLEPPESASAPPITVVTNWTSLLRR